MKTLKQQIVEKLDEPISHAILDGQNQIYDLNSGKATPEQINERMVESYRFHKEKVLIKILSLIKQDRAELCERIEKMKYDFLGCSCKICELHNKDFDAVLALIKKLQ